MPGLGGGGGRRLGAFGLAGRRPQRPPAFVHNKAKLADDLATWMAAAADRHGRTTRTPGEYARTNGIGGGTIDTVIQDLVRRGVMKHMGGKGLWLILDPAVLESSKTDPGR